MNFESYYRKLTDEERGDSPYKYELTEDLVFKNVDLGREPLRIDGYVSYNTFSKVLWLYKTYRWNGSNVVIDTKYCMRASLVHDALYQLFREGKLDRKYRKYADQLYRDIMIEDGAWEWWANLRYLGLRLFAGGATKGKKMSKSPDKSPIYKSEMGEMKQCFCVGPENCEDVTCKLVQEYRAKQEAENE